MGWKSIEMQVALPRTQDAGKLQEQMSKQNQHFQDSLAQSQLKEAVQERNRVQEFEKIHGAKIKDEASSQPDSNDHESDSRDKQNEPATEHPYLGNKIDFNG